MYFNRRIRSLSSQTLHSNEAVLFVKRDALTGSTPDEAELVSGLPVLREAKLWPSKETYASRLDDTACPHTTFDSVLIRVELSHGVEAVAIDAACLVLSDGNPSMGGGRR